MSDWWQVPGGLVVGMSGSPAPMQRSVCLLVPLGDNPMPLSIMDTCCSAVGGVIGLFDSIYAFQCILNILLGRIEPFNTVERISIFICADCSIREYQSDFSPLY